MKKLFPAFATLLLAGFFNDCYAQSSPYVAAYSSNFKIGNTAYSTKVLELWKDWDDNTFDKHDYFADTVVMYLPDGMVVKGKAESIDGAKKYRGGMTSAKSIVHAWVPLYSNDAKQDAGCIWGTETDTWPDGKVETRDLHEVWWFNKDGKVSTIRQWTSKFGQ
jgi:hypothetical protein